MNHPKVHPCFCNLRRFHDWITASLAARRAEQTKRNGVGSPTTMEQWEQLLAMTKCFPEFELIQAEFYAWRDPWAREALN